MQHNQRLTEFLDRFPPFIVILVLARRSRGHVSIENISKISGVPWRTVYRLATKISWSGVQVRLVDAIYDACELDMFRMRGEKTYLKTALSQAVPLPHLSQRQWKMVAQRCRAWVAAQQAKASPE